MAHEITVPRLGWTMEEGVFSEWLKPDGASIREGDELFTLESDKATEAIPSLAAGILRIAPDGPRPGETVRVGALLGFLVAEGEEPPFGAARTDEPVAQVAESTGATAISESVAERGDESSRTSEDSPRVTSSPRARRVARELGVDWTKLAGSGRTGRVIERDVRAIAKERPIAAPMEGELSTGICQPLSATRRLIATRMLAGSRETALVTLVTKGDATQLRMTREQFKSVNPGRGRVAPSVTDLLVKLTVGVLGRHSALNAAWTEEGIRIFDAIHVGIAVDTEQGLVVPVLRNAQAMSLGALAKRTSELIEGARSRSLKAEDYSGGTFTITNLGMHGIDAFTPIPNPPQAAILGVGRIVREPAVFEGRVVPRDMLTLSLTFDHRVVDGGPAARFLDDLRKAVGQPTPWLLSESDGSR